MYQAETLKRHKVEWLKCSKSINYWLSSYVSIFNATPGMDGGGDWVRFALWPAQAETLDRIAANRQAIILKARQLGLSWLVLCYALWSMLFRPAATVLLFSKRDEEATELLDKRLKGIYHHLPAWMQARAVVADSQHDWALSNGSSAKAFPATGGRSYTGSLAIVDEADFVQDLDGLLNAVKPTVDAGGQIVLISTVDKSRPDSPFKRIYRGAKEGTTDWQPVFLPWHARPGRDTAWYDAQTADVLARTGALDDLHQEYPATDTEALAPRTLDKRIPAPWIENCYVARRPLTLPQDAPALEQLEIYQPPQPGRTYVIGADPAEGNPTSDDSALTVMDVATGEEVAALAGKFQPAVLAGHADALGRTYNEAGLMVERNNHGHAVLLWLADNSTLRVLNGHDGRPGWLSSSLGKTLLYDCLADGFRDGETTLHSFATYTQLASIEGATLRAPDGFHDDRADSYALAHVGRAAMLISPVAMRQAAVAGRSGGPMLRKAVRGG